MVNKSKKISFTNVLLFVITIAVLFIGYEVYGLHNTGKAYKLNKTSGYTAIKTVYGAFPVKVKDTKTTDKGTEFQLIILNPTTLVFDDAKIWVNEIINTEPITMDLFPGANLATFTTAQPIEENEPFQVKLAIDKVYFE